MLDPADWEKSYIVLEARRRRRDGENLDVLNAAIIDQLSQIDDLWQPGKTGRDLKLNHHVAGAAIDLTPALRSDLGGGIDYIHRTSLPNTDQAMNDDRFSLGADLAQIKTISDFDYVSFCRVIAPRSIQAFGAYRAKMNLDQARASADWSKVQHEMIEHNRSVEGRDGVIRIWPVSYFDDTLCQRAWGLSTEEVVRRAAPACEEAYPLAGGAFLLVTSELVRGDALDDLSERVMSRLGR